MFQAINHQRAFAQYFHRRYIKPVKGNNHESFKSLQIYFKKMNKNAEFQDWYLRNTLCIRCLLFFVGVGGGAGSFSYKIPPNAAYSSQKPSISLRILIKRISLNYVLSSKLCSFLVRMSKFFHTEFDTFRILSTVFLNLCIPGTVCLSDTFQSRYPTK